MKQTYPLTTPEKMIASLGILMGAGLLVIEFALTLMVILFVIKFIA